MTLPNKYTFFKIRGKETLQNKKSPPQRDELILLNLVLNLEVVVHTEAQTKSIGVNAEYVSLSG